MSIEGIAIGGKRAHPHFPCPLLWHSHLEEAVREARELDRPIFLQHGRRTCSGTRALVERTLAKEEIVEYVSGHFIGLATDADQPDPAVLALLSTLPRIEPTPLCVYLDPDGRLLLSTAGARPPAVLLNDMMQAIAKSGSLDAARAREARRLSREPIASG